MRNKDEKSISNVYFNDDDDDNDSLMWLMSLHSHERVSTCWNEYRRNVTLCLNFNFSQFFINVFYTNVFGEDFKPHIHKI